MKHILLSGLALVGVMLVCATASADEKASNAITLKTMIVYGNRQRPSAAVDVSKVRMQLPLTTPTLAAGSAIQDAAKKDPF